MLSRAFLLLVLSAEISLAALNHIHATERTDVLNGVPFGSAGPYECIVARAGFAVDPKLPANRLISDIDFAPVSDQGQVEFSADLYILKPRDPAKSNGTLLLEIGNRGGKGVLSMFGFAPASRDPRGDAEFGDKRLLEEGYTIAWLGWQFDVPNDPGLMRLYAPVARKAGQPITGLVRSEFVADRKAYSFSLADRNHAAYPAVDPNDPSLQLTVRDRPEGQRRVIPRKEWQFARQTNGKPIADLTHVYRELGFEPGMIYELVYTSQDPVLVGLGPAAVRDFVSFMKNGGVETLLADQRRSIKRALGFGTSQSGRFLRTFLYYGFNADEKNRRVFDGVWAHVAGAGRGSFNHRFAQPSRDGHPLLNLFYPTDIFPFTDLDQTDPETGITDGLLNRAQKSGVVPKIFYTNGSYEYWGRAASLIHTSLDGAHDAELSKETRIYFLTGAQHGPGGFPPRAGDTQNLANPNDYRYLMRGLLGQMNHWLTDGTAPPASRYPLLSKGQLGCIETADAKSVCTTVHFPMIGGVSFPHRKYETYRLDFGEEFRTAGLDTTEPPKVGRLFATLVPQVNTEGNEIAGARMPELEVPLATYTGWNLRSPKIGAPDTLFNMVGSFIPFERTKAERERKHDRRLSIEERYKSKQEYLDKISGAAADLVSTGFLLEADLPKLKDRAGIEWDYVVDRADPR